MLQRGMPRRHLRDPADEANGSAAARSAREKIARALGDRLAFGIAGRRRRRRSGSSPRTSLSRVEQRLRELGRLAEAERQQPGRQRIERAGVPRLLGAVAGASRAAARRSTRGPTACRAAARRRRRRRGSRRGPAWRIAHQCGCLRSAATASSISFDSCMPDLDRVVVGEMQLRHRVEPKPVRKLGAQEARRVLQRLDRRRRRARAPARCVKKTFACERSGDTSTAVIVTMPTRGSFTSVRSSSASSRWIWSPTRCARCDVFFMTVIRPAARRARGGGTPCLRSNGAGFRVRG